MTALDDLHAAVQTFSNHLADNPDDAAVVNSALIVWEETSFDLNDGDVRRQILYAAAGDSVTPAHSLGLAVHLLRTLERDIVGCDCAD